ncbi:sodium:proton antiporter, partial [filamentous cyanobacterium CCP5]
PIVGAFLAGLAVNDVVGDGPVKEKVEFVGSVLFIPFFFVCMGLLLDIPVFLEALTKNLGLTVAIVGGLLLSKWLAAALMKPIYGFRWPQVMTMWSLSLPQVAATLAAAVVGLQADIISSRVFNAVIVLMLVTSLLGPLLTSHYARQIQPRAVSKPDAWDLWPESDPAAWPVASPFTVLVPIYNPVTQRYLIEMAALIARQEKGQIVPLNIAQAHVHMDDSQLTLALKKGRQMLLHAESLSQEFNTPARTLLRVDDDIAEGISRAAREQNANLIVMGWSPEQGLRARLFGTLIDSVFWAAHCPVAVTRLLVEPIDVRKILVPVKNLTAAAMRTVRFAQMFASTHRAEVSLLHVCDRRTPPSQIASFEAQLTSLLEEVESPTQIRSIIIIPSPHPARIILETSQQYDMLVLRSMRRRTAGGLAVSSVTEQVIQQVNCSVVLFGEPHS